MFAQRVCGEERALSSLTSGGVVPVNPLGYLCLIDKDVTPDAV